MGVMLVKKENIINGVRRVVRSTSRDPVSVGKNQHSRREVRKRGLGVRGSAGLLVVGVLLSLAFAVETVAQSVQLRPDLLLLDEGAEGTSVNRIVPMPDGGAVVLGDFVAINELPMRRLAKVGADGFVDPAFTVSTDDYIADATVSASGGVVIAGGFGMVNGESRAGLARLLADGGLDAGWNPRLTFSDGRKPKGVAYDSEGRLYVVSTYSYSAPANARVEVRRILASGQLDSNWGVVANDDIYAIEATDDAIYLAGRFTAINGQSRNRLAKLAIASGELVAEWSPVPTPVGSYSAISSMLISEGFLYVQGAFTEVNGVPRDGVAKIALAGVGALDTAWNPDRKLLRLGFARGGKLYAYASTSSSDYRLVRAATTGAGQVDQDWSAVVAGGLSPLGYYISSSLQDIAPLGDDILIGGTFASVGGVARYSLALVEEVGAATSSARLDVQGSGFVNVIKRGADGSIYVGGNFRLQVPPRRNLLKLKPDGNVDTAWVADANFPVLSLDFAPDGGVVAGGWFSQIGALSRYRFAKLSAATGVVDPAWISNAGGNYKADHSVATDGSIYSGEVKLSPSGQRIAGWQSGITGFGNPDNGNIMVVAEAGDVFVAGSKVARLSGVDGSVLWQKNIEGDNFPSALAILSGDDGWLYVSGRFSSIGGVGAAHVARVSKATGEPDSTWMPIRYYYRYANAFGMSLDGQGNIFVPFSDYPIGLAKISLQSGAVVADFGAVVDRYIVSLEAGDGKLYLGGAISQVNGLPRSGLAALSFSDYIFKDGYELP